MQKQKKSENKTWLISDSCLIHLFIIEDLQSSLHISVYIHY